MSDNKGNVAIRGTITHLFFSDVGFSAGVITASDCETHRFAGPFCMQQGDQVVLQGRIESTKYGRQLKVDRFGLDMPLDREGLIRFLTDNPRFKGIGEERARRIVDYCATEFDRIVTHESDKLLAVKGITPEIVSTLKKEWERRRDFNAAITALASFGLTAYQIDKVIEALGSSAVSVVKTDPFLLIDIISGFGFRRVDEIARKVGMPKESASRIQHGILYILNEQLSDGNTWMERTELLRAADDLLIIDCLESEELIERQLDFLTEEGLLASHVSDNHELIALPSMFEMESYIRDVFVHNREPA